MYNQDIDGSVTTGAKDYIARAKEGDVYPFGEIKNSNVGIALDKIEDCLRFTQENIVKAKVFYDAVNERSFAYDTNFLERVGSKNPAELGTLASVFAEAEENYLGLISKYGALLIRRNELQTQREEAKK